MALVRERWLAAFSSGGFKGHSYPAVGQPESTPEGAGPAPAEVPWGCRRGTGGRDCSQRAAPGNATEKEVLTLALSLQNQGKQQQIFLKYPSTFSSLFILR